MMSSFEDIVKMAQKYLENNPILILGSGASVPYGLPSMYDLSNKIKTKLGDFYKGNEYWDKFCSNLNTFNDLEKALQEIQLPKDINDNIISTVWEYINDSDIQFFSGLINDSSTYALAKLLKKLLYTHPSHVSIVTTNYDRLAEYAADIAVSNTFTGFYGNIIKSFDSSHLHNNQRERRVDIWKVHGSLDWFKNSSQQLVSIPLARSIPNLYIPLIVTPGVQKYQETHNEPYRTVISRADECISRASCYLCIGYGFNDEHIQPKLITQIQQRNIPIVIITRKLSLKGREILSISKSTKYIVFEEGANNVTNVTDAYGKTEIVGEYWKLNNFITMWFGN